MQKERFKLVSTSFLVLIKDRKILLLRRFNTGHLDGNYSMGGGPLDGNETFTQAAVREAKEEAGIEINPKDLQVVHAMHRKCPNEERIDVYLLAKEWKGEPKNMEPHKCDDLSWFRLDNLPGNVVPYVKQAIDRIKNKAFYSEHG